MSIFNLPCTALARAFSRAIKLFDSMALSATVASSTISSPELLQIENRKLKLANDPLVGCMSCDHLPYAHYRSDLFVENVPHTCEK